MNQYCSLIIFSNIDMPNLKDIALVCLLQSGLTHNDLKKLFLEETTYSPEYVWKSLKNKTIL